MKEPLSERRALVCLLALALGCAQAHSRRERGDRDAIDSEPSPIEREATPEERDPSEGSDPPPEDTQTVADPPAPQPSQPTASDQGTAGEAPPAQPDSKLQVFDPNEVYVFGDANGASCETAVAPASDPGRLIVGFGCTSYSTLLIRPSDGRLLYSALPGGLRVFSCDGCVPHQTGAMYPLEPVKNDVQIASPCTGDDAAFPVFSVLPSGAVLHYCDKNWLDAQARTIVPGEPFIARFGHGDTALREDGVLRLSDGQLHPLAGLPDHSRSDFRAREDGYWILLRGASDELWHVRFDGSASPVGAYPALPAGQTIRSAPKLDGDGRLVQIAREDASERYTVVRRSVDGTSEVIYADPAGAARWKQLFFLFTGP